MTFWLQVLAVAFPLFLLMDPVGNIPIFIAALKNINPRRQRIIIMRELLIALAVIIGFNYAGDFFLKMLHVNHPSILISGGLILFLIALKMIFPVSHEHNGESIDKEPFIVPLAIPLVAGPAVLAAVMLYSQHQTQNYVTVVAIVLAWAASTAILLLSSTIQRILGQKGIIACERLMGLILTLISVQMFLEGIALFAGITY